MPPRTARLRASAGRPHPPRRLLDRFSVPARPICRRHRIHSTTPGSIGSGRDRRRGPVMVSTFASFAASPLPRVMLLMAAKVHARRCGRADRSLSRQTPNDEAAKAVPASFGNPGTAIITSRRCRVRSPRPLECLATSTRPVDAGGRPAVARAAIRVLEQGPPALSPGGGACAACAAPGGAGRLILVGGGPLGGGMVPAGKQLRQPTVIG
jgi:hypothetical protein